jgi:hypothetical protein
MIITASRRTDIPAFYLEWFANRIKEGYVLARNPRFGTNISKIILRPDIVDCIIFVTKNPAKMLDKLGLLDNFNFLFQYTLNPYGPDIEQGLPTLDARIDLFIELSKRIGKKKTIWRYDPIALSEKISPEFHIRKFAYIAGKLKGCTEKCIISFIDVYRSAKQRLDKAGVRAPDEREMRAIAAGVSAAAESSGIQIATCAESIDLDEFGIGHGKCVDEELVSELFGLRVRKMENKPLRKDCACARSIDIGEYNTCVHNCLYCYANFRRKLIADNISRHRRNSPLLTGEPDGSERIFEIGSQMKAGRLPLFR